MALAATTASPLTKVSAIGPSSSSSSSVVPGLLGGALGEPVLDHAERRVGLAQLRSQLSRLGDADAAVVDREDRLGLAEALGDLVDQRCLVFLVSSFILIAPDAERKEPARRRAQEILDLACAGLPGRVGAAPPAVFGRCWLERRW